MKQREQRKRVTTPARMRSDTGWSDVTIRDISSRGMGLVSSRAPRRGDYIEVCRHKHKLVGRVMWSEGESFGILLSDSIVVDDLLSSRPPARYDTAERRQGPRGAGAQRPKGDPRVAVVSLAENSRNTSRLINFAAIAAIASFGAFLAADFAGSVLSHSMDAVSAGLASSRVEATAG